MRLLVALFVMLVVVSESQAFNHRRSNGCNGGQAQMNQVQVSQAPRNGCNGGTAQSFTPVQNANGTVSMQPVKTAPGLVAGNTVQTAEPPLVQQSGPTLTNLVQTAPATGHRRRTFLPWNR